MKTEELIGKFFYNQINDFFGSIIDISEDDFIVEIAGAIVNTLGVIPVSEITETNSKYKIITEKKYNALKEKLHPVMDEFERMMIDGDLKIFTDGITPISPSISANIYLLNFYGPTDYSDFMDVVNGSRYSNLNEFFHESNTIWSVPMDS